MVKEKENLCKIDYKISESKAVLTCYFNEDIASARRNFTVYKHNGQDKESTTLFCAFSKIYGNISNMYAFDDKCLRTCNLKYMFALSLKKTDTKGRRDGEKEKDSSINP